MRTQWVWKGILNCICKLVLVSDGAIAYAGMSDLSLSIIQNTVRELISSQKKEPKLAPRKLASGIKPHFYDDIS